MENSNRIFTLDHSNHSSYGDANPVDANHIDSGEVVTDYDALIRQAQSWSQPGVAVNDTAAQVAARAEAAAVRRALRAVQLPTAAAPEFPAAIGWGLIGVYAAIMLDFVLFFTGSRMAALMVGVSVAYVIVYLATPVAFMTIERKATGRHRRVSLGTFLKQGVETWTGHLSGWEAIVQIFTIPVVVSVALFAIGIAWQMAR